MLEKVNAFSRIPRHVGVIPDGNRRWAASMNMDKSDGYAYGVAPGFRLVELLIAHGVEEATFYGFTKDNTSRPAAQTRAYVKACVDAVNMLAHRDANLMVVGRTDSNLFPDELRPYAGRRVRFGRGLINVNFLVNYDWGWDLAAGLAGPGGGRKDILDSIASRDIPRINLIIRWGGRTRLSGFLPVQSVYADFYVIRDYWPGFQDEHLLEALRWYQCCDATLGG